MQVATRLKDEATRWILHQNISKETRRMGLKIAQAQQRAQQAQLQVQHPPQIAAVIGML